MGGMNKLHKVAFVATCSAIGLIAADYISATDHLFAKTAAQVGLAQMKLGQLAVHQASSPQVKDLGQRMVNDYKAMERLKAIAAKDNILLPSTLSARDQSTINRLSSLSGPAFDKAYMDSMMKEHDTAISLFQNEANAGSNADLKNFASSTLPLLQALTEPRL